MESRRKFIRSAGIIISGTFLTGASSLAAIKSGSKRSPSFHLSTFRADVTPPADSPLCGGMVKPVVGVTDQLLALGVVILGSGKPIVLCAVDWCEIHNSDQTLWREKLAAAAGTTPERVTVHTLHQHNAPLADTVANKIMMESPSPVKVFDAGWGLKAIETVAENLAESLKHSSPVTHVAAGEAIVSKVASNRRVMGPDGKVAFVRYSATKDPKLQELPEGLIDPKLRTVSFWNGNQKLVSMHYYATHPMSYYGDGLVTYDFVGIAREQLTREEGLPHIYFNGCGGNITAGKYNDGSKANRNVLAERIHKAMVESELKAKLFPLGKAEWRIKPVVLTADPGFNEEQLLKVVADISKDASTRIEAALRLSFMRNCSAGMPVQLTSLHLGDNVRLLHLPAESFVEYQLFAQQQAPDKFVATAAYSDTGAEYIPLEKSFAEGGYEPTWAFAVPATEKIIKDAITGLLSKK
jgi:hypothetical protein